MRSKKNKTLPLVAIIGLGYVGLPLALLAARKKYRVVGIDTDQKKIDLIRGRKAPFEDDDIAGELKKTSLEATTDFKHIEDASVIVICVPTPVDEEHMPDLEPVKTASQSVAAFLKPHQLVVLESTVNPGVTETIIIPILEAGSGLTAGEDFFIAHCPERINPGDVRWRVETIPRVVGSLEKNGLRRAAAFYRSILKGKVTLMESLKEAEAVKIVENSFRDINIAFVNELARSFTRLGIDVVRVIDGAATKPFSFMAHYPGCGVGGHCIPVDPYYLIEYAKQNGFHHEFLSLARRINNSMPQFAVDILTKALEENEVSLAGSRIALLGLAYKADIDDVRESPALEIADILESHDAEVISYDPFVPELSKAKTLKDALRGAQAVLIATNHSEFVKLLPKDVLEHDVHIVIDGRNCLPKERFLDAGVTYRGIGR